MASLVCVGEKRKHDDTATKASLDIIEISSDEDEAPISLPPAKRQKSATPAVNSRNGSSHSRDSTLEIPATPSTSRVSQLQTGFENVTRSPFKKLSRYSFPSAEDNLLVFKTESRESQTPLLPNGSQIPPTGYASSKPNTQPHFSVDIRTRQTPTPQANGSIISRPSTPRSNVTVTNQRPHISQPHQLPKTRAPLPQPKSSRDKSIPQTPQHLTPSPPRSSADHVPTPSQTNIEIVIPKLIEAWTAPLPKSKKTLRAEKAAARRALLNDLKISADHAKERPDEVYRLFGQTGFSTKAFSTDVDLVARQKLASKKQKKQPGPNALQLLALSDDLSESLNNLVISESTRISPEQSSRMLLTNRFNEDIHPPLTFTNDVNEQRINGKFQFTDRYILQAGVKPSPPSTNYGCKCVDKCALESCDCFSKVTATNGKETLTEQRQTYTRRPDGIVVLTDEYMAQELDPDAKHFEISECNEFCACGDDCWNRVVGKGRTVPLDIFQTAKCGFGVRSSVDIVKGQFIELYLGELITEAELQRREAAAEEKEPSYIYSLDWFTGPDNRTGYHVDGQYFGSATRFVNHSCNPNTRCFTVQTHRQDKRVYYLAFFAIRDIARGAEILIDYAGGAGAPEDDDGDKRPGGGGGGDATLDENLVRCYCGETNCRKILWNPKKERRRRRRRAE